jgi:hypothetical protein
MLMLPLQVAVDELMRHELPRRLYTQLPSTACTSHQQ